MNAFTEVDAASRDPDVVGVRCMFELMAREPRLSASQSRQSAPRGGPGSRGPS
jgi:hypothetical protein